MDKDYHWINKDSGEVCISSYKPSCRYKRITRNEYFHRVEQSAKEFFCVICKDKKPISFGASASIEVGGWYCSYHTQEDIKRHLTKPAPDAGDSAASSELVQASALSTSQTDPAPTQRG
jgi:hypothetical protein